MAGRETTMRFAFAGIDFLWDAFEGLVQSGWEPVKLFTRPCDRIYDFNDLVVAAAQRHRIPIQLSRLTAPDLAHLSELGCEVLAVAGYPWRVPAWDGHLAYAFNVHPSPLPIARGPYPLFRALYQNFETWGVTAHVLAPEFDAGPILAQRRFPVAPGETHDSLLAKCQMAALRLGKALAQDLPKRWREAKPQAEGSYWPRVTDLERTLDWSKSVEEVLRTVRAFGSIEVIARLGGTRMFVRAASGWTEAHHHAPGTLVHSHHRHLVVAVRDGFVQITAWSPISRTDAAETAR